MPFKGTLTVGDSVEIEFVAHHANPGTTIVSTGYVPRPSMPASPVDPPVVAVVPGSAAVQTTLVGPAFTLIIDVDVPPAGGGQLEVRVNGTLRDSGAVGSDVNWSYLVV